MRAFEDAGYFEWDEAYNERTVSDLPERDPRVDEQPVPGLRVRHERERHAGVRASHADPAHPEAALGVRFHQLTGREVHVHPPGRRPPRPGRG